MSTLLTLSLDEWKIISLKHVCNACLFHYTAVLNVIIHNTDGSVPFSL